MSWGVSRKGTVAEVKAQMAEDFASIAKSYPPDTLEGEDVELAKNRVFKLLDALDMSPDSYYAPDLVQASANGSHSWGAKGKETPRSATFSVNVFRVPASQAQ
jgi:hypothetical protein